MLRRRRRHRARHARRSSRASRSPARSSATAKGPKINGFTYKRRTNQRRRYGHRQRYTVVEITKIATKLRRPAMSKTKGGGSTRNGRDSNAQRLGVKVFDGTKITRRHDHRAPARHQVPPRQERRHRRRRHAVLARRRRGQVRRAQGPQVVDVDVLADRTPGHHAPARSSLTAAARHGTGAVGRPGVLEPTGRRRRAAWPGPSRAARPPARQAKRSVIPAT